MLQYRYNLNILKENMTKPINIPKDFAEQLPETIAELQRKQAYYSKLEKAADEVKAAAEKYTQILEQWENNIWETKINTENSQTIYSSEKDDTQQEDDNDLDKDTSLYEDNTSNEEKNEVSQEDNNNQENKDLDENNYSEEDTSLYEDNNSNEEKNEVSQKDNNQEDNDLEENNSSEEEVNTWPKINLNNFLHKKDEDNEVE